MKGIQHTHFIFEQYISSPCQLTTPCPCNGPNRMNEEFHHRLFGMRGKIVVALVGVVVVVQGQWEAQERMTHPGYNPLRYALFVDTLQHAVDLEK